MLPILAKHFPDTIKTYWEPFVGGGAVLYYLSTQVQRSVICDVNETLITIYLIMRDHVEDLIECLQGYFDRHKHDRRYFKGVLVKPLIYPLDTAARCLYALYLSFSHKVDFRRDGSFNASLGLRRWIGLFRPDILRASSRALQNTDIYHGDYRMFTNPLPGDLVFADPPYDNVKGIYINDFDHTAQIALRDKMDEWCNNGATVIQTNADTPLIRDLYQDYRLIPNVTTSQFCAGKNRQVREVIIV